MIFGVRWKGLIIFVLGGIAFLVSVYAAIYEAISEKDWPRETFKFVLWFGIPLAILAAVVSS